MNRVHYSSLTTEMRLAITTAAAVGVVARMMGDVSKRQHPPREEHRHLS
jgi:hypothetical protein